MTKEQLTGWGVSRGWQKDKWGHLQKEIGGKQYRFKLSKISARYEVKGSYGWLRIRSGYLKDLTITPEGKLSGLRL